MAANVCYCGWGVAPLDTALPCALAPCEFGTPCPEPATAAGAEMSRAPAASAAANFFTRFTPSPLLGLAILPDFSQNLTHLFWKELTLLPSQRSPQPPDARWVTAVRRGFKRRRFAPRVPRVASLA